MYNIILHILEKIRKIVRAIFHKVQKTAKKDQKGQQIGPKMLILGYFAIFYIFGPFLFILNQKKNSKIQK